MTPKEKSIELVNKYLQIYDGRVIEAKQCAIIAVDEIIEVLIESIYLQMIDIKYWQEVKKELL
jgi:hypothetical protein